MALMVVFGVCFGLLHLWSEHDKRKQAAKRKALRAQYVQYVLDNYTVEEYEAIERGYAFMAKHTSEIDMIALIFACLMLVGEFICRIADQRAAFWRLVCGGRVIGMSTVQRACLTGCRGPRVILTMHTSMSNVCAVVKSFQSQVVRLNHRRMA